LNLEPDDITTMTPSRRSLVLLLAAGTFTGLVQAYAQSRGLMAFSARLIQALGLLLVAVGGYLVWLA